MRLRIRRSVSAVVLAGLASATVATVAPSASGAALAEPRTPLVDPCEQFNGDGFLDYTPEEISELMSTDYATLRQEINECQGKAMAQIPKPKLKKPKVPKIKGQPPVFWVYVMGSQTEMWNWSLPLEPDPVMCTAAMTGQRFTVVSPIPTGATLSNAVGNGVGVNVKAGYVDTGWGRGSDCDPQNDAGTADGMVTFDFSTQGIRLESFIGPDLGWEYTNDSDSDFLLKFSKKDRAALLNPKKGVLTFLLDHTASGDRATDTEASSGPCSGFDDEGTCTWAHSWGLKIVLVRAEPMDLVYGP